MARVHRATIYLKSLSRLRICWLVAFGLDPCELGSFSLFFPLLQSLLRGRKVLLSPMLSDRDSKEHVVQPARQELLLQSSVALLSRLSHIPALLVAQPMWF